MKINLNEITINPDLDSIERIPMSDEEYFGPKYSNYTSNSRLKLINPDDGGSPLKYKEGFKNNQEGYLALGTCVHSGVLTPNEFILGPDLNKPTAKLGLVIDKIIKYRDKGYKIIDSINMACHEVDYYKNSINDSRINKIISEGLNYYINNPKDGSIILPSKDRKICIKCIENLKINKSIMNLINPKDIFGDPIESYTEDAFFMDFICNHNDKECRIKFKMKADSWSIDHDNKVLTLNDLKTTSKPVNEFLGNSFIKFHYYTQFSLYLYVLIQYCKQKYGYDENWTYDCNVMVVGTRGDNETAVYKVIDPFIKEGKKEFCRLLKMVAYCEMYGYDDDYMFI